nr:uncharacterized protein LOC117842505 [Setaria viridis]
MSDPRLLPRAVPGPAGDGAAAVPVRPAAAAQVAGLPRGLPGGAVLLLSPRRVLLRPLHHLRLLIQRGCRDDPAETSFDTLQLAPKGAMQVRGGQLWFSCSVFFHDRDCINSVMYA